VSVSYGFQDWMFDVKTVKSRYPHDTLAPVPP
jgi:hypothetical protein